MDWKKKLIDLADQRAQALAEAEKALNENDQAGYDGAMERVGNLNAEIQRVQNLLAEQQKRLDTQTPDLAEQKDMAEERGHILQTGGAVSFTAQEVRRAVCNNVTLATGTLVEPTGGGSTIRDPLGNQVSSIVDQVFVQDLTGMGTYLEPYVISELDAKGGKVSTSAGTARTTSADPVFGVAEIRPYELNVTTFVDRNLSRLSPAGYYEKIHGMAMRAMRRKLAGLIVNGDGQTTPDMYGINTHYARPYMDAANGFLQDQIVFGSAYPFIPMKPAVETYESCFKTSEIRDKIMYKNALRGLKLREEALRRI